MPDTVYRFVVTKSLAIDLGEKGIIVALLHPGDAPHFCTDCCSCNLP